MKIKTKIALRYSVITTMLMTVFAVIIYFTSSNDREIEFYEDLYREGLSRANLYFEAETTPETMHSIYRNNSEYIDEVEVAVYTPGFDLLYHDAKEIDIVKETSDLIDRIQAGEKNIRFYVGKYQAIGFNFIHNNSRYVVTAAAYDGYGYNKLQRLAFNLLLLTVVAIIISFTLGYFLARRALIPVSEISDKMKNITANNLHLRLLNYNQDDEFGELAASFNKVLDIMESSFESQKLFVSNVSHELRTPLAALVGEIDYALLKQRTNEEYTVTLLNSKDDVMRLIRLVNGLLNLAKASYDESKISKKNIRIDEVLLDARREVLRVNTGYSIELQFSQQIEDDTLITVKGNEYLLKMAFLNLMENSCKFSPDKTATVRISTEDGNIHICFSDNGIGIPEEDLVNIFKPFYRGRNKEFIDGNGIGLALVSKVITIHKGNVNVKSHIGQGTSFYIELPVITIS